MTSVRKRGRMPGMEKNCGKDPEGETEMETVKQGVPEAGRPVGWRDVRKCGLLVVLRNLFRKERARVFPDADGGSPLPRPAYVFPEISRKEARDLDLLGRAKDLLYGNVRLPFRLGFDEADRTGLPWGIVEADGSWVHSGSSRERVLASELVFRAKVLGLVDPFGRATREEAASARRGIELWLECHGRGPEP